MQISIAILTGKNISSSVPKESYSIYDCTAEEYQDTNKYPIVYFNIGDRVYLPESGSYGYIDTIIPSKFGVTLQSLPIGYCNYRCNDSDVSLSLDIKNDIGVPTDWYAKLYGIEVFGEDIPVISYANYTLTVQFYFDLELFDGDNYINHSGTSGFVQDTYNINSDENVLIDTKFLFNTPEGYGISSINQLYVTSVFISNTYGPYYIGWEYNNRFLTDNGNVWTFYWPIN